MTVQPQPVVTPWREQDAVHPRGVTCTTMRLRQSGQKRGGSSSSLRVQASCTPAVSGSPQWPQ